MNYEQNQSLTSAQKELFDLRNILSSVYCRLHDITQNAALDDVILLHVGIAKTNAELAIGELLEASRQSYGLGDQ